MPKLKWKMKIIREQLAVLDGKLAPTIMLKNVTYLHSIYKTWKLGNIWIYNERIVYVGEQIPKLLEGTEIVDLTGHKAVPGYIEPHVHPFQLYNPQTFADYSAQTGTTTFISDNMTWLSLIENKKAFTISDQLSEQPFTYYWWSRFDSQTERDDEREIFSNASVNEWLQRSDVLLGGELTGWPKIIHGDDQMLSWVQTAKELGKKVEGHLPGASERTLAKMKLIGVDGDHEAMTLEDVENRLQQGYAVTLRYSSIRPDLPNLLKEIVASGHQVFDHLMMTTDGATPNFYKDGVMDMCIRIALDQGVQPIDAYQMASYNVARYYGFDDVQGQIATGRLANINILNNELQPTPVSVLSKGKWLKKQNEKVYALTSVDWTQLPALKMDFELTDDDFQFSSAIGVEMVNDVITKPYRIQLTTTSGQLSTEHDESYLILIDRYGKWRINTILKGFGSHIKGFASTYSNTGDFILIGKNFADMQLAFNELKKTNGGMALAEDGKIICTLPLSIAGAVYDGEMSQIMELEENLKTNLEARGYKYSDAIYTLLFLQATHLPYIRITPKGLFDVMKNSVVLPAVMR